MEIWVQIIPTPTRQILIINSRHHTLIQIIQVLMNMRQGTPMKIGITCTQIKLI